MTPSQLPARPVNIGTSFPSYCNIYFMMFKFIFEFKGIFAAGLLEIPLFDLVHRNQIDMAVPAAKHAGKRRRVLIRVIDPLYQTVFIGHPPACFLKIILTRRKHL